MSKRKRIFSNFQEVVKFYFPVTYQKMITNSDYEGDEDAFCWRKV